MIKKFSGLLWKLALIALVCLSFYMIYLDSVVTKRFTDARFQAPALLYSRAFELSPGLGVTKTLLERELKALDYRPTRYARNVGEYRIQGQEMLLYRRGFDFPDGYEPDLRVRLRFDDENYLVEIETWPEQNFINGLRLEPQLIGRFASDNQEERLLVGLEQVPQLLQQTLLLVEDRDFYHHWGVKPTSIIRAALANLAAGRTVQGGSTITQQLVKNMFLSHEKRMIRKVNEALMALILDFRFGKDEILEAYFNEVYFGQDRGHAIHGIGLASQFYFGKQPEQLSPAEIAMLVGMIRGPGLYNPYRHTERAEARRDLVLHLMFEHDLINQPQLLAGLEAPVVTRASARLIARQRADYIDLVQAELRQLVPGRQWQQTGLKVFTYFDPWLQADLEESVYQRMEQLPDHELQAAAVLTDYHSGTVRALVGGRTPVFAGFNRAFQARRQIGSLMKPLLYTLALEDPNQYTLATMLYDEPMSVTNERGVVWEPRNFDGEFKGPVSLYQSWLDSRNIPAVEVGQQVTPARLRQRLLELGVKADIRPYPALALGTLEVSPLAVNELYGYLANYGEGYRVTSIHGVTTHRGDILYLQERRVNQGFQPEAAYLARYTSHGVVEFGTGRALGQQTNRPLGGKTGSTNELRDSWFVSFDNRYLLTVWLGRDDNQPTGLTGSRGALPVAQNFWRKQDIFPLNLAPPPGVAMRSWDAQTGLAVAPGCPNARALPGVVSDQPVTGCGDGNELDAERDEEQKERGFWRRIFNRGN
ncbi:MAG: penicillin-binding protein 1B [Gammaproteobacteria bacterium]|nr:penicillin-binding protein 1B [Gammaproteobacteria bacterium]